MSTRLDSLLQSIAPERTLEELDRRVDGALNSFLAESQLTDWNAFRRCLVRFLSHVDSRLLRVPGQRMPEADLDYQWGRCCQVLMKLYGSSGEKAAFEMARTGNQGGLRSVLRKFARERAKELAESEVAAKVGTYWNGLSATEKLTASDEYLSKYGHLLPSELTEKSAARIRANLPRVLQEHPELLQRMQQVGRSR